MAITLVQETGGVSATTNPTLKYPLRVSAGQFLLAFCQQQAFAMPGIPTDTAGNPWQMIACTQHPAGLCLCLYRVPVALAGSTTVTFPTTAPSAVAIQAFSGVLADQNVGTDTEVDQPHDASQGFQTISPYATSVNATAGDFCEAVICTFGGTAFTATQPGWTLLRSISSANVSMQLLTQTASVDGPLVAGWTTPSPVQAAVAAVALAHA